MIAGGAILGIIASLTSIWAILKIDRFEELAERAKSWKLSIALSNPRNGTPVFGSTLRIFGQIEFRIAAADDEFKARINLSLSKEKIDLVPYVRPISESKWWWAQPMPFIHQDGSFEGLVFIGEKQFTGQVEYQVIILAVPKGTSPEGSRSVNLPFFYAASNAITLTRVQ